MRRGLYIIATLGLLFLQIGCGKKSKSEYPSDRNDSSRSLHSPSQGQAPGARQPRRFHIRDIDNRETLLMFQGTTGHFQRIRQPIVLLTLFSDWCPPCRGMLPYLSRLQQSNRDDLFVIGLLLRSDLDRQGVRRFMQRYATNFFISLHPDNGALAAYLARQLELDENYPLPLTLIFKNGKYVMNIRGAVPYEMLQTLVDQLKRPQKTKE